ncbi:hypothetical protein QUG64_06825 [Acinetobacter lwoffii]|uniref:Uncharacterized protein n=2 Tax=Acinetobacter lwoffii TaxID=28090 RepID=A0AAJ4P2R2_ACILW|nr:MULTISPECIES: hypothetical protein [Acinetobacter]ENU16342.1 hypothetical protein F995_01822 [Acinetobacter sp. CIP A162]ESJ95699.1 hypothetical protein P800_00516 [Acinetobacter lwoffii NCTC 5866 = CIP 64.10 = NIPH 512]QGR75899.1 hypothetical protein FOB21_15360 [Acinetobacter lwoffii]QKT97901.1 hypothetical protein FOB20_03270 [Acinetobacter lwoffii]QXB40757.1 hypothetical protein I6L23_01550 [Acinetobacter lwoffii]
MVRGIANSKIGFGDLILLLRYFFKLKVSTHPILLNEYLKNENLYKITKSFNQQTQERNVEYWNILKNNSDEYARETIRTSQIEFDPILEQLINYTLYK